MKNIDDINLRKLFSDLVEAGLVRRFGWLAENTLDAIRNEITTPLPKSWAPLYRRTLAVLAPFVEFIVAERTSRAAGEPLDVFDPSIRSEKTVHDVAVASSPISKRWRIVTSVQPADFADALRDARVDR